MSDGVLLEYERSGGRPPADDERLLVRLDGRFEARRTLGGPRIGTFEGSLDASTLRGLADAVGAAREAGELAVPTPMDGATETLRVPGAGATLGSNERPAGAWGPLVERARELLDTVVLESPSAGVELSATPGSGRLAQVGSGTLEIDLASLKTRLVRLDEAGLVLARWQASAAGARAEDAGPAADREWSVAGPGWSSPIPYDHPIELAPGDRLQVWVTLELRQDGRVRGGRLFRVVRPGGR